MHLAGHASVGHQTYWGPLVVSGHLPTTATFDTNLVAALASLNDLAGNFGHALFDFLNPVYNMLSLLGTFNTYCIMLWLARTQGFTSIHNTVTCIDCGVCKIMTFVFVVLQEFMAQVFSFF